MGIDKIVIEIGEERTEVDVVRIKNNPSMARRVIQKRLDYAHRLCGAKPDSIVKIDDSAYSVIEQITQGNPGFALYAIMMINPSHQELEKSEKPYIITEEYVRNTRITQSGFEQWWELGRDIEVLEIKRRNS